MNKYVKANLDSIKNVNLYVMGCGKIGSECTNRLVTAGVEITGYMDNAPSKWGDLYRDKIIFSPQAIAEKCKEAVVIVAIEKYHEPLKQMQMLGFEKIMLYSCREFYEISERAVMGMTDIKQLKDTVINKQIVVCGNEKNREDFIYVFDWLNISSVVSESNDIPKASEDVLLVVCEKNGERYPAIVEEKGYVYGENLVYAQELFCILDCLGDLNYYRVIPSVLMDITWNDSMKKQYICKKAFEAMWVSSSFNAHCCCPDWSMVWGDLQKDSLDAIWNSIIAKLFRLSLINRTYSFCNINKCVYLKPEYEECSERMTPMPVASQIPKHFEIGIDKTCNLFCRSCRDKVYIEKNQHAVNKVKDIIIDSGWLDRVDSLLLGGQGEVFFSNVYKEMMFNSDVKRKSLELRTNGILLTKDYLDKLIERYEKLMIIVSIDAATKETYNYLRRSNNPDSWEILQENLKLLSEYRMSGKLNFFQINMCVQMKNYLEIADYVQMGMDLGVDRVYITPIRNWGTYTEEEFMDIGIFSSGKNLKLEVQEAIPNAIRENKRVLFAF